MFLTPNTGNLLLLTQQETSSEVKAGTERKPWLLPPAPRGLGRTRPAGCGPRVATSPAKLGSRAGTCYPQPNTFQPDPGPRATARRPLTGSDHVPGPAATALPAAAPHSGCHPHPAGARNFGRRQCGQGRADTPLTHTAYGRLPRDTQAAHAARRGGAARARKGAVLPQGPPTPRGAPAPVQDHAAAAPPPAGDAPPPSRAPPTSRGAPPPLPSGAQPPAGDAPPSA